MMELTTNVAHRKFGSVVRVQRCAALTRKVEATDEVIGRRVWSAAERNLRTSEIP